VLEECFPSGQTDFGVVGLSAISMKQEANIG
jgi:hypothetical protein